MNQRRINVAVFGFLGVIVGIVLAAVADYSTPGEVVLAMVVGALAGGIVGAHWSTTPDHRRPRITSR